LIRSRTRLGAAGLDADRRRIEVAVEAPRRVDQVEATTGL